MRSIKLILFSILCLVLPATTRSEELPSLGGICDAIGETPCDAMGDTGSGDERVLSCWDAVGAHAGLPYQNDFSYLDDPTNEVYCFGDCLKRLCKQDERWLEIGGSSRLRFHDEQGLGRQLGTDLLDDASSNPLLAQLRVYANWRINPKTRIFVEGFYADVVSRNDGYRPRGNERNRGDFMNLFFDHQLTDDWLLRFGRQQIRYGSRRVIAGPSWANTSRNHDGARLIHQCENSQFDLFYFQTVTIDLDKIDDVTDDRLLFGAWSTTKDSSHLWDLYYVGYRDQRPGRQRTLHHLGSRLKGGEDFLYELEGVLQFGQQTALGIDHLAGQVVAGMGKKLKSLPWSPTLWMYFELATGDDGNGKLNRYDRIYDRAHHYLGFIDLVSRSNMEALSLQASMKPTDRIDILARYYRVYANQGQDIVAAVGGAFAPQRFDTTDYGDILEVAGKWRFNPRSDVRLGFSYFWPGEKLISQNEASFLYAEWNLWF